MAKRRPSGDGMVRKRDDGRWEGRIVVGHKDNGDPIFRYVYAPTQKELTSKLRQMADAYEGADLTEDSRMTLGEWLDQWLVGIEGTIRPSTLARYQSTVRNHIKPVLGDKVISQLTPKDIQKFEERLATEGNINTGAGLSSSTVRSIHNMLHEALSAAEHAHLILRNPTEGFDSPKFSYKEKQIFTDEQLDRFMSAIQDDPAWHDLFYTEITTGLRRGELCGLKWEDFDSEKGTLTVRRSIRIGKGSDIVEGETKTGKGKREIVLPASTVELLEAQRESALTEWIFPDPLKPERPTNPSAAYKYLKALLKQANLPDIRFHDLRHPYVKPKTKKFTTIFEDFRAAA